MSEQVTKGLVICYIGNGKGKTTAAMGLAARALGARQRVVVLQFVKAAPGPGAWPVSSEVNFFKGNMLVEQVGLGFVGIIGDHLPFESHVAAAKKGLDRARQLLTSGCYHTIILDELISAVELKLVSEQDVVDLISIKPPDIHMVLTGHDRFENILRCCDLVTDMQMVKHPYYSGIGAQEGIDY